MNECRESDSLIVSVKSSNKICDNKHMAEISIPEKEIADVGLRSRVVLKFRAYPEKRFQGTVISIASTAAKQEERGGPTVLVTTELDNNSLLLKPMMTGLAKIYCGKRRVIDLVTRRLRRYIRVEFWSWW